MYFCLQIRHRFGLFDEVCTSGGIQVRHCNWVRFLRVSDNYGPQVSTLLSLAKKKQSLFLYI